MQRKSWQRRQEILFWRSRRQRTGGCDLRATDSLKCAYSEPEAVTMETTPTLSRGFRLPALTLAAVLVLTACSSSDEASGPELSTEAETVARSVFDGIRRAPVIHAAQAVCDGTSEGLADAPGYDPEVDPAILIVLHQDNPDAKLVEPQADEILGPPHLLLCVKADLTDEVAETCEYEGNNTVEYRVTDWTVRLVRADNGEVLESSEHRGSAAQCRQVVFEDSVQPVMVIYPPDTYDILDRINQALDPYERCRLTMSQRDVNVTATTETELKARLIVMNDFPEPLVLPETMRAADQVDAQVALCARKVNEGARFLAVMADGTVIGEWLLERPEGEAISAPAPMPPDGWFAANVGPALGY